MREIKFRAWDKTHNQMLYRTIWDRNWYATSYNDENGCHCVRGITPDDKVYMELMQYTGLKDKNGKEIYEGDIIKFEDGITGSVEMQFFSWVIQVKEGKHTLWDMFFDDVKLEVIGNIYENKELLNQ